MLHVLDGDLVHGDVVGEQDQGALHSQFVEKIEGLVVFGEVVVVGVEKGLPEVIAHHSVLASQHAHEQHVVVLEVKVLQSAHELVLFDVTFG